MVSCRTGGFLLARAAAALQALQIPHGTVRLLFKLTGSLQQPPSKCQVLLCCWRHVLLVRTSMTNPSCRQRQHQAWHVLIFNVCILCCM